MNSQRSGAWTGAALLLGAFVGTAQAAEPPQGPATAPAVSTAPALSTPASRAVINGRDDRHALERADQWRSR